ncbi:ATP-binding cassette domain-containing protein [Arthrobacter sp. ISL-48]|uniref:ABC transporter ATP-binding protein/permease n=1 Tax=Arthrobacter sp. ISL-48 TaxID=2819110 RepID=UPI001BE57168|nr:ATP-binding cassette domain-containing protein [Arthrobacter sp. ISL-48]MBT2533959.1 ATP-binding cassette domain-containing protein [Arthrobacter sp. ISL-48]
MTVLDSDLQPANTPLDSRVPLLSLQKVSRLYPGSETAAIDDVSLDVYPGDFVAIVGPSGSGKSTLLNILGLLDSPTSGDYQVLGIDSIAMDEKGRNHLRSKTFGFVFQSSHVLGDDSVLANAAMGLRVQRVAIRDRVKCAVDALVQVGLKSKIDSRAKLLSGGERQRVAIARAIATSPALILADEPTGNLDSENSRRIVEHLHALHRSGATVVVITHDMEVAATASRRVEILDGRIVEDSTTASPESANYVPGPGNPRPKQKRRHLGPWGSLVDDVLAAVSALSTRGVRTLLLMAAFALGIGGLVTSVGLSETASAQISSRLTAAALDEVRVDLDRPSAFLNPQSDRLAKDLDKLANLPHVQNAGFLAMVQPADTKISRLYAGDAEPSQAIGLASTSRSFIEQAATEIVPSTSTELLEDSSVQPVALVSRKAAEALGFPLGDDRMGLTPGYAVWIDGARVPIVGLFQVGDRFSELESSVIVSPGLLSQNPRVRLSIVIKTDMGFPAAVARAVPLSLAPESPGSIKTQTVADLDSLRFGVSNDLGLFVGILSSVLLALTAASAATVMYLTVQSRTSEIALLRAIGAGRGYIGRLFMIEGLLISSMGGAIGIALGVAGTLFGALAQGWTPVLAGSLPLIGMGASVLTGLISSLYPAWVASRQNPATAIRG